MPKDFFTVNSVYNDDPDAVIFVTLLVTTEPEDNAICISKDRADRWVVGLNYKADNHVAGHRTYRIIPVDDFRPVEEGELFLYDDTLDDIERERIRMEALTRYQQYFQEERRKQRGE